MTEIQFVSTRGRVYTQKTVVPVVIGLLRKMVPACIRVPGWETRVRAKLADDTWCRFRSGQVPAALARDLDEVVLGFT